MEKTSSLRREADRIATLLARLEEGVQGVGLELHDLMHLSSSAPLFVDDLGGDLGKEVARSAFSIRRRIAWEPGESADVAEFLGRIKAGGKRTDRVVTSEYIARLQTNYGVITLPEPSEIYLVAANLSGRRSPESLKDLLFRLGWQVTTNIEHLFACLKADSLVCSYEGFCVDQSTVGHGFVLVRDVSEQGSHLIRGASFMNSETDYLLAFPRSDVAPDKVLHFREQDWGRKGI